MSMDTELQKHYALLLGIGSPWEVKTVALKLQEKKVEIELGWQWGQSAKCLEHGVKTMAVPQGRFTLLFERFVVEVLLASASVSQACELLGIGWEMAHEIMRRAVERGPAERP